MGTEVVDFEDIHAFKMSVKYNEITVKSRENTFEHHIHSECEIYLNISGDVSLRILSRCLKNSRGFRPWHIKTRLARRQPRNI